MPDAPVFSPTLERLYLRLPEFIQLADPDNDWAAKRYLALVVDQLGDLEVLADRIDYIPPNDGGVAGDSSELVDPTKADAAWLPWLAQLVGVPSTGRPTAELRLAISTAGQNFDVASTRALLAAIKSQLADPQRAALERSVDGSVWKLGVVIHPTDIVTVAWDTIESTYPDWAAIEAAGTWTALGDHDPLSSPLVTSQKPVGVQFVTLDPGDWAVVEGLLTWTALEALATWDALEAAPF